MGDRRFAWRCAVDVVLVFGGWGSCCVALVSVLLRLVRVLRCGVCFFRPELVVALSVVDCWVFAGFVAGLLLVRSWVVCWFVAESMLVRLVVCGWCRLLVCSWCVVGVWCGLW